MALAYINNLGGMISTELVDKEFMDVMSQEKQLHHITTQHLQGADAEFQTMMDQSDWKLNPFLFRRIVSHFGPISMDPYVSHLTNQCKAYNNYISIGSQIHFQR